MTPRPPSDDLPGYDSWKTNDEPDETPARFRDTRDENEPDDREQWERERDFDRECDELK